MSMHPGSVWLAHRAPAPQAVYAAWEEGELATILPEHGTWAVAQADVLVSIDVMGTLGRFSRIGPVLTHAETSRAWWLVSPEGAEVLARTPQMTLCRSAALRCPPADYPVHGRGWLEKPDAKGTLTDPQALAHAFHQQTGHPPPSPVKRLFGGWEAGEGAAAPVRGAKAYASSR